MRIGYISTYPPIECGIATYTQYLREAFSPRVHETFVLSQVGAEGKGVHPVYHPDEPGLAHRLFQTAAKLTPDIVHIQHEYGLFGPQHGIAAVELTARLRLAGIPSAVTLHTVYDSLSREQEIVLEHLVRDCSAVIVHEEYQKRTLDRAFGRPEKTHVIEHGIREVRPVRAAKEKLGLAGKRVVMMCGYFRPTKGFDTILEWWPKVAEECPDAVLVMAGKIRGIEAQDTRAKLMTDMAAMPHADRVRYFRGQFPQHTLDTLLSAADAVVLPYRVGAQSGMLSQCLAFGAPVVSSDLPAFVDVLGRTGGGLICEGIEDYAPQILRVLEEPGCADGLRRSTRRYIAERGGWSRVAERHLSIFEPLINPTGAQGDYAFVPDPADLRDPEPVEAPTPAGPRRSGVTPRPFNRPFTRHERRATATG